MTSRRRGAGPGPRSWWGSRRERGGDEQCDEEERQDRTDEMDDEGGRRARRRWPRLYERAVMRPTRSMPPNSVIIAPSGAVGPRRRVGLASGSR